MRTTRPAIERFLEKVKINEETGCWEWQGFVGPLGYGQFKADGRRGRPMSSPHRYAFMHYKGPIPEGTEIDHLCNNRGCCNPDHLEAVTKSENHLRAFRRGRKCAPRPRPTHCKYGHEYTPTNTIHIASGSIQCRICDRRRVQAYRMKQRAKSLELTTD